MGYAHLNFFVAYLVGFILSGFLLNAFCPDPNKLSPVIRAAYQAALRGQGPMPGEYAHAAFLWYVFAAIGMVAFLVLLVFQSVTQKADKKQT